MPRRAPGVSTPQARAWPRLQEPPSPSVAFWRALTRGRLRRAPALRRNQANTPSRWTSPWLSMPGAPARGAEGPAVSLARSTGGLLRGATLSPAPAPTPDTRNDSSAPGAPRRSDLRAPRKLRATCLPGELPPHVALIAPQKRRTPTSGAPSDPTMTGALRSPHGGDLWRPGSLEFRGRAHKSATRQRQTLPRHAETIPRDAPSGSPVLAYASTSTWTVAPAAAYGTRCPSMDFPSTDSFTAPPFPEFFTLIT